PEDATTAFFRSGNAVGATCIFNPAPAKPIARDLLGLIDLLIVNETELAFITGLDITDSSSENELRTALSELNGMGLSGSAIVTLGARGSLAIVGQRAIRTLGHEVKAIDTTGAGDCFVGSVAAELSRGASLDEALAYANMAGSLCVQRQGAGTSMPTPAEVINCFRGAVV